MAGETLTTLDKLTKDVYLPGLPSFVNNKRPLFGRISKVTDKQRFKGRKFLFAALNTNNQGTAGIGEDEELPESGNVEILNMELALKYHYAVARMTAQAIRLATSDRGAFKDSVKTVLNSTRDQLEEDLAIHGLYGTGAGDLGQVSSYSGSTLTMIGQPTVGGVGTRMLRKNMYVQSWAALSGGSVAADHKQIENVTSTSVATVPTSAGFVANDYVFRSRTAGVDPRNKVMMGLGGLLDNAVRVATIQGLSRSTYPTLNANVLGASGVLRAWTPELMDDLGVEASQNGGGGYPTAFYSRIEIQKRAAAYLYADRRLQMEQMRLQGGWSAIAWNVPGKGKVPWFEDRYCRPNEIMAPHEPDLFLAIDEDVQFDDMTGSMWKESTERKHAYEAWLFTWRNMGSRQFNNHSVLRDISHTA